MGPPGFEHVAASPPPSWAEPLLDPEPLPDPEVLPDAASLREPLVEPDVAPDPEPLLDPVADPDPVPDPELPLVPSAAASEPLLLSDEHAPIMTTALVADKAVSDWTSEKTLRLLKTRLPNMVTSLDIFITCKRLDSQFRSIVRGAAH
jgi:hypothetical protein